MYEGDVDIDKDGEVAPELQGAVEPDRGRKPIDSESTKNTNSQTLHSTQISCQIISVGCLFRTFFFPGSGVRNFQGSATKVATLSAKSKSGTVHFFGETLSCRGLVQGHGIWVNLD
jgi:hypothetical protein